MGDLEKLLEEAKLLGVKNADNLDIDSLLQAIDEKKAGVDAKADANKKAKADVNPETETKPVEVAEPKADPNKKAKADVKPETETKSVEVAESKAKDKAKLETGDKVEKPLKPKNKPEPKSKPPKTFWTDANGIKWGFRETAPKSLNWNGEIRTQEDLLNDDSVMKKLTLGQYSFIKRLS